MFKGEEAILVSIKKLEKLHEMIVVLKKNEHNLKNILSFEATSGDHER